METETEDILETITDILQNIVWFLSDYLTETQIKFVMIAPVASLIFWVVWRCFLRPGPDFVGKHVVITGGATRLGRLIAIEAAKQGAHVSIFGRESLNLLAVKETVMHVRMSSSQKVTNVVADVGDLRDLEKAFVKAYREAGPIDMLITCEGYSICGLIEHISQTRTSNMLQTNLIGTMNAVRLAVGDMKRRKRGSIVLVGSELSLMGMYGYTLYAACKFGIRGLAESIRMELKPFNINVSLCIYPDTDSPKFQIENRAKPSIMKKRSPAASGNLINLHLVAENILKDALVCIVIFSMLSLLQCASLRTSKQQIS